MKFLLIASILFFTVSCSLTKNRPDEILKRAKQNEAYDAIIVPGCPYKGTYPGNTMKNRILWSKHLYEEGVAKNIIYSGSSVYTEYYESVVMSNYGKSLGIPEAKIFIDSLAEHSTENVYYSYLIAKKNGFKKIALATDAFQCNSLVSFIKKHELDIDILPIDYKIVEDRQLETYKVTNWNAINTSFVSIKERESFFKRLSGTLGKNIVWHKDDLPNEKLISKYSKRDRLHQDTFVDSRQ